MYTALMILHVLVAFTMVGVILLQSGKGAEIGAAFGGSSQTVFGARGASTFLSKMTAVAATIFMITSLSLAIIAKRENTSSTIGLDQPVSTPSVPAGTAPPPGVPTPTQPMTEQHTPHDSNAPTPATPAPTKP